MLFTWPQTLLSTCWQQSCAVAGGAEEAQAAYDEAVNAVFNMQVECHRHTQPHISKKSSGITKWAMVEMWPMQVTPSTPHHTLEHLSHGYMKTLRLCFANAIHSAPV